MSKLPSMPFFVDAYLGDTMHLTTEEHGAYLLLLMSMWRHSGFIPDDDGDNARICRMSLEGYRKAKERLMPFFIVTNHGSPPVRTITQARLQKEWNRAVEVSQRQSERGKKSGEVRRQQKQEVESNQRLLSVQTTSEPRPNRTRTPIPIKDITTSLQVSAREAGSVAAAPDGAAPSLPALASEPKEVDLTIPDCLDRRPKANRLDTPYMRRVPQSSAA